MTPIDQRSLWTAEGTPGDCMTACIATLLDLPYDVVPFFSKIQQETGVNWFQTLTEFLEDQGYEFKGSYYNGPWDELAAISEGVGGFYVAEGPSPRGPQVKGGHCIVVHGDGSIAHDPHPSREGLVGTKSVWMIERKPAHTCKPAKEGAE